MGAYIHSLSLSRYGQLAIKGTKSPTLLVHQSRTLRPLAEDLVIAGHCEPEAHVVVVIHPLDRLLKALLANLDRLDPALDVLLRSQLQHLLHLGPVANVRGTHVASVRSERLSHHRGQRLVGETDHVEGTVDLQGGEVVGEIELVGSVGAVEDDVELELPGLGPVLLVAEDEVLSTELQCVVLLVRGVRDDICLRTERIGPENTEVAETSAMKLLALSFLEVTCVLTVQQ